MRLCYNCEHMMFDGGYPSQPGYSELTPGTPEYPMEIRCVKNHWDLAYMDMDNLREYLESAGKCKDYKHSVRAKELGIQDDGSELREWDHMGEP